MFSPHQVTAQVEQIGYSSMGTQESLSLNDGFELTHASLSHPCRLVRLLGSVVHILFGAVDRLRYQLTMRYSITMQFISHNLSGFSTMTS